MRRYTAPQHALTRVRVRRYRGVSTSHHAGKWEAHHPITPTDAAASCAQVAAPAATPAIAAPAVGS